MQINLLEGSCFRPYTVLEWALVFFVMMYYSDFDWTPKSQKRGLEATGSQCNRTALRILGASSKVRTLKKRVIIIYDWSDILIALFTLLQTAVPVV
jgi:hypothetical protein